jgi:DNA-binding NarL/FixJ family response regulator
LKPEPTPPRLRVLIADDHEPFRRALEHLLSEEPSVRVVAQASNGDEAMRQAAVLRPDVVLMDLDMPGSSGLAATSWIVHHCPGTRVILMACESGIDYHRAARACGASGFVTKEWAGDELLAQLRALRLEHMAART